MAEDAAFRRRCSPITPRVQESVQVVMRSTSFFKPRLLFCFQVVACAKCGGAGELKRTLSLLLGKVSCPTCNGQVCVCVFVFVARAFGVVSLLHMRVRHA